MSDKTTSREAVREGLTEVRAKITEDLSQWGKARRVMTLSPTLVCLDCEGTGTITCPRCNGAGTIPFGDDQEPVPCANCNGAGHYGCVTCASAGSLPNPHRKKIVIVLWVGLVAWLLIFIRLYLLGHDVLPEFGKQGGGGVIQGRGGPAVPVSAPGSAISPGIVRPGTGAGQPGVQPGSQVQPPAGQPGVSMGQPGMQPGQGGYGAQGVRPSGAVAPGGAMGGGSSTYQPGGGVAAPGAMGGGASTYQPGNGATAPGAMGGGASTYQPGR